MIEGVGQWWGGCEGTSHWLGDTESDMVTHKPLASSLTIIEQQKKSVQVRTYIYIRTLASTHTYICTYVHTHTCIAHTYIQGAGCIQG